jgi:hypothetical protein
MPSTQSLLAASMRQCKQLGTATGFVVMHEALCLITSYHVASGRHPETTTPTEARPTRCSAMPWRRGPMSPAG